MNNPLHPLLAVLALLAVLFPALAAEEAKEIEDPIATYFTETELLDQDGKTVRFYSDALKGKVVVIHAFYTQSTGPLPAIMKRVAKIQESFGDRVGKDVFLISITVDPETDTPQKLAAYAKESGAKAGWLFLTGKKDDVQTVLKKLGLLTPYKAKHPTLLLVGNVPTGLWTKAMGLADADELVKVIESVIKNKAGAEKK